MRGSTSGERIDLRIRDSHFWHGDRQRVALNLSSRVRATIERTDIFGAGTGLQLDSGADLDFFNNVVAGNGQFGMILSQGDGAVVRVINNTIDRNVLDMDDHTTVGTGIRVDETTSGGDFLIRTNSVTNHGSYGIRVTSSASPALDHNNVWRNGVNYDGTEGGVGAISSNPLYREAPTWREEESDFTFSTNASSGNDSMSTPLAHWHRMRYSVTANPSWCSSALRFLYNLDGVDISVEENAPQTRVWTDRFFSEEISITYSRTLSSECNTFTSGAVDQTVIGVPAPGSYNYRLSMNSPLLDAGNTNGAPEDDRDGAERPNDGNLDGTPVVDIGAFEWRDNVPPVAIIRVEPGTIVAREAEVTFDGRQSRDPDGEIVRHTWIFPDGDEVGGEVVTKAWEDEADNVVILEVEDDQGETATDQVTISVVDNLPPIADAGPDRTAEVGQSLTFDGGNSVDPDGTIVAYEWDFDDESPVATGVSVSHAWARAGVYEVSLEVTDNRGAIGTDSAFVVVTDPDEESSTDPGPLFPPTANAGTDRSALIGEELSFDGGDSESTNGDIVEWSWQFGDGETASGATVTHTYSEAGLFLVRLRVTDEEGLRDTDIIAVQVREEESSVEESDSEEPTSSDSVPGSSPDDSAAAGSGSASPTAGTSDTAEQSASSDESATSAVDSSSTGEESESIDAEDSSADGGCSSVPSKGTSPIASLVLLLPAMLVVRRRSTAHRTV